MDEISPEDRNFLEALAGRRKGTPAESALRSSLLQFAQDSLETEAASKLPLTADDMLSQVKLRQALIDAGALPAPETSPSSSGRRAVRPEKNPSLLDGLAGLFGGGRRGDAGGAISTGWRVPAGALVLGAVALMFVLSPKLGQNGAPSPDVTRGQGSTVKAAEPAAKCAEIVAKLLQVGVSKDMITESGPQGACIISVRADEPTLQAQVAKVFQEAGGEVAMSARMELTVVGAR